MTHPNPPPLDAAEAACENEWACNKSTLLWQRIHCKCLLEAQCAARQERERDAYEAYLDRRMGWN